MTSRRGPAPTNRDLIVQREREATAQIESLLLRLEAAGDRVKVGRETYEADVAARDALVWEAQEAGLSQQVIARVGQIEGQPNVARAKRRHRERMEKKGQRA